MRRREPDTIPAEQLIPVSAVAARIGYPDEMVWNRLQETDVTADWDGTPCLPWSRAKQIYDQLSAEKREADDLNQRRIAEQLDREHFDRTWPTRAYEEAAARGSQRVRGVEVSLPGEDEPDWAKDVS